jgi:hypothetical protein
MVMKFNRVWLRIMQRRFWRWLQSLFAPRPIKRTVAVPEYNGWTATQKRLEEESYLANPHAVWLKPDRFETRLWMEGVWERGPSQMFSSVPGAYMVVKKTSWVNGQKVYFYADEHDAFMQSARLNARQQPSLAQMQMYRQLSAYQQQAGHGLNSPFSNLLSPRL